MLNTMTKMDIRLIDLDENALLQIVDHYRPSVLQSFDNEYKRINDTLKSNPTNSYYHYINAYGLEYIAAGIWNKADFHGCIIIGPFISSPTVMEFVSDIISRNNLPVSQRQQLEGFYKSLSVVTRNEYSCIGELLVNISKQNYIQSEIITTDIIVPTINKEKLKESLFESKQIIEIRYENEKKLMDAIAKGDKETVEHFSKVSTNILDFSNRIPESPIRSAKNIALVLNTLCRIAAERGNLHPIYIHNISEKFAILIERSPNLNHLKSLCMVMINEYCDLVKIYSTKNYSPIVKKAVDYIHFNLEEPLTLNDIAAALNVNPSHLSRKFKEDTNTNIIDYINHKRIDEAKLYLQRGNTSVTEVAFLVGYNDHNYFTRVFKKITSITPSQYMKGKNSG
ncbi:helix-turn-helix transcriptional regulator [Bacillus sp. EB600]|nr:helix-turn-helix transcriptional regulator [Bacillus sp. EB600]